MAGVLPSRPPPRGPVGRRRSGGAARSGGTAAPASRPSALGRIVRRAGPGGGAGAGVVLPPPDLRAAGRRRRRGRRGCATGHRGGARAPGRPRLGAGGGAPRRLGRRTVRSGARRRCLVRGRVDVALGLRSGGRLDGDRTAAHHRATGLGTGDRRGAQHAVSWLGGAPPARRGAGRDPARAGAGAGARSHAAEQRAKRGVQRPGIAGGWGPGPPAAAAGIAGRAVAGGRDRRHAAGPGRAVRDRRPARRAVSRSGASGCLSAPVSPWRYSSEKSALGRLKGSQKMASLAVPSSSRIGPAIPPPSNSGRRALDAELIRRTLSEDDAAARELHRHYRPIVASFLRKLGTQPHEIEDTCQDVFTTFFRHIASFRGEAELKTWVFRLCASEARKVRRKRRLGATLAAVLRREPPDEVVRPGGEERRHHPRSGDARPRSHDARAAPGVRTVRGRRAARQAGRGGRRQEHGLDVPPPLRGPADISRHVGDRATPGEAP